MTEDGRNFRLSYYDKVGFKEAVGDKVLISILKEDTIDEKKLQLFCVRFSIPCSYRLIIWQILLEILPVHRQSHQFVLSQREQQYNDLVSALKAMNLIRDESKQSEVTLKLYLLEQGKLGLIPCYNAWHDDFTAYTDYVHEVFDSPAMAYWVNVRLYCFFRDQDYMRHFSEYQAILSRVVKTDNIKLFSHLENSSLLHAIPLTSWLQLAFAGVFHCQGGVERIWDILLGQVSTILAYVSAAIILAHETQLFECKNEEELLKILNNTPYPEENSKHIISTAIKLWKKYEKVP